MKCRQSHLLGEGQKAQGHDLMRTRWAPQKPRCSTAWKSVLLQEGQITVPTREEAIWFTQAATKQLPGSFGLPWWAQRALSRGRSRPTLGEQRPTSVPVTVAALHRCVVAGRRGRVTAWPPCPLGTAHGCHHHHARVWLLAGADEWPGGT